MCGLFGMLSSSITQHEARAMSYMSYLTCFRGIDSTGVAMAHKVGKSNYKSYNNIVYKSTQTPPEFMRSEEIQDMFKKHSSDMVALAGHSRAATQGSIKASNAHPFRVKHLIGMHNGTVHSLADRANDKTDSQRIYEIMAEDGLQKAINECKYGAYALVWLDQEDKTINFLRNEQRPLYFMRAPGNIVLWMSEKWMLDIVREYMSWSEKAVEIVPLPEHTHIKIALGSTVYESMEVKPEVQVPFFQELGKKEEKKVDHPQFQKMYPPTAKAKLATSNIQGYPYNNKEAPLQLPQLPKIPIKDEKREAGLTYRYVGPVAKMDIIAMSELFDEGCFNCQTIPDYDIQGLVNPFRVFWLPEVADPKKSVFLCQDCVSNRHHQNLGIQIKEFTIGGLRPHKES